MIIILWLSNNRMVYIMRAIFLDIDGVLNCISTKDRYCNCIIGIEDKLVKSLHEIVKQTDAKIVLCSSWKLSWNKTNKNLQGGLANYLDKKLKYQDLYIFDKTTDNGRDRGCGIRNYLKNNPHITSWCVIDDEIFDDYEECSIMGNLVKTEFYNDNGGIQAQHIDKAVSLLMTENSE